MINSNCFNFLLFGSVNYNKKQILESYLCYLLSLFFSILILWIHKKSDLIKFIGTRSLDSIKLMLKNLVILQFNKN